MGELVTRLRVGRCGPVRGQQVRPLAQIAARTNAIGKKVRAEYLDVETLLLAYFAWAFMELPGSLTTSSLDLSAAGGTGFRGPRRQAPCAGTPLLGVTRATNLLV